MAVAIKIPAQWKWNFVSLSFTLSVSLIVTTTITTAIVTKNVADDDVNGQSTNRLKVTTTNDTKPEQERFDDFA